MKSLKERWLTGEKMDDPNAPEDEIHKALREIETINKWLGGYRVILGGLDQIIKPGEHFSLIDLGCGGGDSLRKISQWSKKKNIHGKLTGIDINPKMIEYCRERSLLYPEIKYKTGSVWCNNLIKERADIVMNSLFCHHFDNEQIIQLVSNMHQMANRAVIINDLHRHWFAYHSIKMITSIFSDNYLVKFDAPVSVARSLRKKEWEDVLQKAGISNYQISWKWAWRWQIIIRK